MKTTVNLTATVDISHDSAESLAKAIADLKREGAWIEYTATYLNPERKARAYSVKSRKGARVSAWHLKGTTP